VQELIERADAPDEPAIGPRENARGDLRQRLERLADGHPSSDHYRDASLGRGDESADTSRADTSPEDATGSDTSRTDTSREDATRADTSRTDTNREETTGTRRDNSLDATERASSAWEHSEVRAHPDRPTEGDIRVTEDRARHILDGDPDSDGGGHRYGTGRAGKTEFPQGWPDDVIISVAEDVGRQPDHVEWQPNGRWRVTGDHDGVRVYAVVLPDGRMWTAWPEPGGKGVVENPEAA
jgi:hypothetical protein